MKGSVFASHMNKTKIPNKNSLAHEAIRYIEYSFRHLI